MAGIFNTGLDWENPVNERLIKSLILSWRIIKQKQWPQREENNHLRAVDVSQGIAVEENLKLLYIH